MTALLREENKTKEEVPSSEDDNNDDDNEILDNKDEQQCAPITMNLTNDNSMMTAVAGPPKLPVDRDWLAKLLWSHHPNASSSSSPSSSFRKLNAYVLAPMVDQSELPFRLLCRSYGTNLCFTPMIHAKLFATVENYRNKFMLQANMSHDRPLVAQICGADLSHVLYTARTIAPYCDAIDLNCGCPQGIARRGMYGAFLLEQEEILLRVVRHLLAVIDIPLTVKVRLLPGNSCTTDDDDALASAAAGDDAADPLVENDTRSCLEERRRSSSIERSLRLYGKLVDAGVHMLTIHGRTRFHKGVTTGPADWDAIRQVVDTFGHVIPILANGSISCPGNVRECLRITRADGIMSSEAILEYPALFHGMMAQDDAMAAAAAATTTTTDPIVIPDLPPRIPRMQLAWEYLRLAQAYPPNIRGQGNGIRCVRVHLHRILHGDLKIHADVRKLLVEAETYSQLEDACRILEERQKQQAAAASSSSKEQPEEELSWYMRHRNIYIDEYTGVTVNGERNTSGTDGSSMTVKTALEHRMQQESAVLQADLADDAAECFACLFGQ